MYVQFIVSSVIHVRLKGVSSNPMILRGGPNTIVNDAVKTDMTGRTNGNIITLTPFDIGSHKAKLDFIQDIGYCNMKYNSSSLFINMTANLV